MYSFYFIVVGVKVMMRCVIYFVYPHWIKIYKIIYYSISMIFDGRPLADRSLNNVSVIILYRCYVFIFLVYDITKRSTFLNLQRWIEEVRRYTGSNVLLILVGKRLIFLFE